MSVTYQIGIQDTATPELRRKIEACRPERLNAFIGPRLVRLTQGHFLKRPHNKKGWKPVNFYADAARSTNWRAHPEGVILSVNKLGIRQRYQGGVIRPVNKKMLAFPVAEEAYGKTPADFANQLQLVVIKGKGAWLALKTFEQAQRQAVGPQKRRGGKQQQGPGQGTSRERLKFLFRLSAGLQQDADPDVLPTDEEFLAEAIAGAREAVR